MSRYAPSSEGLFRPTPGGPRPWRALGLAVALMLTAVAGGCAVDVGGKSRPFVRSAPLHGEVEVVVDRRSDAQGTSDLTRRYEALEFKEIVRVKTQGDVYHPDLLSYRASAGLGSTQFRSDLGGQVDRGAGTLDEYNLSGELLDKKPYPVTFELDKSQELIPRQFASSMLSQREGETVGLSLRSAWPMRFQFGQSHIRQEGQGLSDRDLFARDDQRFAYTVDHAFGDRASVSFDFQQNDVSQTQAGTSLDHQEEAYALSHHLAGGANKEIQLNSFVNILQQSGAYDLTRTLWQERLGLRHTDTFQTHYAFSLHESARSAFKSSEGRGELGFTHQLYQSLTTTGTAFGSQSDLGEGVNLDQVGGGVGWDYRKRNVLGTLFGHYGFDVLDLQQTGGRTVMVVVDERHAFDQAGSMRIQLDRPGVDRASIVVYNSTRSRVYRDYAVTETGGVTEIQVLAGGDIASDAGQTLSFDYDSVTEPQRREQSMVHNLRLRERVPWGLSAYYEYQNRSESLQSTDTIPLDEFRVNLWGVDFTKEGFRMLAEYREEASTRIPSSSRRVEASYSLRATTDTRMTVYGSSSWNTYSTEPAYDVRWLAAGGEISAQLTAIYRLSGGLDYRNEDDSRQGNTKGLQCTVNLACHYRQLTAQVGAEYGTLDRLEHEQNSARLYLRLKRMF
jgi:hypothetical protein